MTDTSPDPAESRMLRAFPGAVHDPTKCPLCLLLHRIYGVKHTPDGSWRCRTCEGKGEAHRFAPVGPRRGFLWTLTATGEVKVCTEAIVIDSPPRVRKP